MSNRFKNYMNPYGPGWMSVTIIVGTLMVASLISMIARDDLMIAPQLVMLAIVAISLLPLFRGVNFFKTLEEDPAHIAIERDFEYAVSMRDDRVRFGEYYIYIKRSGRLLKYSEITQVYQYVHKTNFVEDERALKYVDTNGKHRKMCKLELRDNSNAELSMMVSMILKKNPYVKVGYR